MNASTRHHRMSVGLALALLLLTLVACRFISNDNSSGTNDANARSTNASTTGSDNPNASSTPLTTGAAPNASVSPDVTATSSAFPNGAFVGTVHNTTSDWRASLRLVMSREDNRVTGLAFIGPPLAGSGIITGTVAGTTLNLTLRSTADGSTIQITGQGTPDGGITGTYITSDSQRGTFTVTPQSSPTPSPGGSSGK